MMGRALLIVGILGTMGLVGTAVLGYVEADERMPLHLMLALLSCLLLLFSHCWIMFYLIGTGKAIKTAVREHSLEADLVEETKRFKNRSYPSMMLAMGLVMATFVLGGGVYTDVVPTWIHHVLFWLTLVSQVRTLAIEASVLTANERLMDGINRRLAA